MRIINAMNHLIPPALLMPYHGMNAIKHVMVPISLSGLFYKILKEYFSGHSKIEEPVYPRIDIVKQLHENDAKRNEEIRTELLRKKIDGGMEAVRPNNALKLNVENAMPSSSIGEADLKMPLGDDKITNLLKKFETQWKHQEETMADVDERLTQLDQEWEDLLNYLRGGKSYGISGCPKIDADALKTLDDFTRAAHPTLDPLCAEHAKVILTPSGETFDEAAFEEKGCQYIKPKFRQISLMTAVDKNLDKEQEATKASINVNVAAKTLCDLAKRNPSEP